MQINYLVDINFHFQMITVRSQVKPRFLKINIINNANKLYILLFVALFYFSV